MWLPSSFGIRFSNLAKALNACVLLGGIGAAMVSGCSSGYAPHKVPEPDIDALLAAPLYIRVRITHERDAARSITTTASAGTIIMEYLIDDKLVGSHSVHSNFNEVINLPGEDHEIVIQQCYRGIITLGGRSCQYIKYHFRIRPGESGQVNVVEPNVLRPKTAGFIQWYEVEASRY
jgi:hypothetical protein